MRDVVSALAGATRATLSLTPVIVALWVTGLVVARAVAEPWAEAAERFLAHAPDARAWLREWHPTIVDEFLAVEAARVDAGSDALRAAALPWVVGWTIVSGGVVAAVTPARRGFVRDAARLAHRFAWLLAWTAGVVVAIGWCGARLDAVITSAGLLDPERDRSWLASLAAAKTVAQLAVLHVVLTIHRLARVRVAVLDERFVPRSWFATARAFVRRAPTLLVATLLAAVPLGAAFAWAARAATDASPAATWTGHLAFLAVVAALVFRTAVEARLWPLYGPAWRPQPSRARRVAVPAAACLALVAPNWLDDAPGERVTRAEILDDVVVAETYLELRATDDLASLTFVLDGDAALASARLAEGPPDAALRPTRDAPPSLPIDADGATARVTLPELVSSGDRLAVSLVVTSPRVRRVRHGAEVLDAVGLRLADHVPATAPDVTRVVVWSPEDVLVEATGGAGVVGTDGAGRARAEFTSRGIRDVRAVALPRAVARSSVDPAFPQSATTIIAAPGVMRTHRAVLLDATETALRLLAPAHPYPHEQLTLVLDPTPSAPRAHGATWCVVPVTTIAPERDAWIAPLVTRLAELTGATSPRTATGLARELSTSTLLPTSTSDALGRLLSSAIASGAWSLDVPFTDRALGPLDACGWWRSPYLPDAPRHAAPLAEPRPLGRALDSLRGPGPFAWPRVFHGTLDAGAAIVDARTTGGAGAWTHTIVVERGDESVAPDVELLLSDGTEPTHRWPEAVDDRWVLEVDGRAPLVAATLRFDDTTRWLTQPWHDDARLATPDHGAADALTHAATRWNELALWGWAAVF